MRGPLALVAVSVLALPAAAALGAPRYSLVDFGDGTWAEGISSDGRVTGTFDDGGLTVHAFAYGPALGGLATLEHPEGKNSRGLDLNASGHVVGFLDVFGEPDRAFVHKPGVGFSEIAPLGGGEDAENVAHAINDAGFIVGFSDTDTAPGGEAFLYDPNTGIATGIGSLGGQSEAYDINNSNQITGDSYHGEENLRYTAFLYDNGAMTDLGTLGGIKSLGNALNDDGHVVGWSDRVDGKTEAFLYDGTKMIGLGILDGGAYSEAYDINAHGQIVGLSDSSAGQLAFLYEDGEMLVLNDLLDETGDGWSIEYAAAINDDSLIAATAYHGMLGYRAVLLTPIPEPASLLLAAVGGACVLPSRRRP